jgi:hypothetical protein
MPLPLDADILFYVWSTLKIMFGSKSRLRKNSRPIPLHYQYQILTDEQLTPGQKSFLAPIDAQLASINFRPVCTYRVTNYGNNLLRRYDNPADRATCSLTIVEIHVSVNGVKSARTSSSAAFTTRLASGKMFVTKNMAMKSLFDRPDYILEQRLPNETNLVQLKKKHDQAAANLGPTLDPPRDTDGILQEVDAEHDRYLKFQVQYGALQPAPDGQSFVVTDKVFDRGIRNHFLPFGKRLSLTQILFAALLGAFLPLLGILKVAPWLSHNLNAGPNDSIVGVVAIAGCYALAGAIIGWLCDMQKFTFVMLVAYVPQHLIAGWSYGWFPYATLLFLTCFQVAQLKRRNALILQT